MKIGLSIDQIVNVDQQSESFTVVGSLQMMWKDPLLAFSPDECHCTVKMMDLNTLTKILADEKGGFLPAYTFFNQQGNRWSESKDVFVESSGQTLEQVSQALVTEHDLVSEEPEAGPQSEPEPALEVELDLEGTSAAS